MGDDKTQPAAEETILEEGNRIINGQRQQDYGSPKQSFDRIAALWSGYLGQKLTALDVVNLMTLLKVSRAKNGYHRDSYVDIAGYVGCVDLIRAEEARDAKTN